MPILQGQEWGSHVQSMLGLPALLEGSAPEDVFLQTAQQRWLRQSQWDA